MAELDERVVEASYGTRHSRWNSKRGTDLRADLVWIAMVCEMGTMMAGIIMVGRTGAAYAAQLGIMKAAQ